MKDLLLTLEKNERIAKNTYLWVLSGDLEGSCRPGQFVNIKLDGFYLRRPISVCDLEGDRLTLIFKAVGRGTEKMAEASVGERFSVLVGLGNGYNLDASGENPLLIGGGAGVPPMYMLCKELVKAGKKPTVVLGFNTKDEVFFEDKFSTLGAEVLVATADGSHGVKGFVTDAMRDADYSYFYTCGPEPMLKAVHKSTVTDGELSFEERMGCGFGACMGCSCKTLTGYKRICKEGPVMKKGEILW